MMYEEYIKEKEILEKNEEERDFELIQSLIKTKLELELANKNFEYAEAELIDYYTYEIKASQSKLDYLLKKIKKRGLILDQINEKDIQLGLKNEVS